MIIKKHIDLLGFRVSDKVTSFEGVVSSICFDLYGCIQACVTPGKGEDGKLPDSAWFDVSRLEVISPAPVMALPDFVEGPQAEGLQGPADKPLPRGA